MSSLFEGLEKFGIDSNSSVGLFEKEKELKQTKIVEPKQNVLEEKDFLLDKKVKCPTCDKSFLIRTVKNSKIRRLPADKDLRPRFEVIDVLKYDVIACPHCGFAILSMYYKDITVKQTRLIQENISKKFNGDKNAQKELEEYSYDIAMERYKLALLNAVVKKARDSEKAYICLKAGWVMRGQIEETQKNAQEWEINGERLQKEEEEFSKNAYEGFLRALEKEEFPMCGMDQDTLEYIIASLAMRFGKFDVASKIISRIIVSKNVSRKMKDRAIDVKGELIAIIRSQSKV